MGVALFGSIFTSRLVAELEGAFDVLGGAEGRLDGFHAGGQRGGEPAPSLERCGLVHPGPRQTRAVVGASERLEIENQLVARGGTRIGGVAGLSAAPGTIFVQRPSQQHGRGRKNGMAKKALVAPEL